MQYVSPAPPFPPPVPRRQRLSIFLFAFFWRLFVRVSLGDLFAARCDPLTGG